MRISVLLSLVVVAAGCPTEEEPPPPPIGFRAATFPSDFQWGTALAGWQVEGDQGVNGPVDSNWSRWMAMGEGIGGQTNPDGNGFFTLYADDAQRAVDLGLTQFRLSADWSRIVPQPGVVDEDELDHLVDVITTLRASGLEPVLTLYHWTVPPWVQNPDGDAPEGELDLIGRKDPAVVDAFEEFVRAVIPRVADQVDTYTVLNEPLTMIVVGYIDGRFPPGDFLAIERATDFGINLARMHARAYDVIKELDDTSFVGLTMTANDIYPERPESDQEVFAADSLNYVYNDWFLQTLTEGKLDVNLDGVVDEAADTNPAEGTYDELANRLDFIGVQYYGPTLVKEFELLSSTPPLFGLPLVDVADYSSPDAQERPHNGMGREIHAAGFADTLDRYAQWNLPIIITENGTTTNRRPSADATGIDDLDFDHDQAAMYLVTHIWEVGRAIQRGVDVRGYYHWTLVDNYEWVEGRRQRFGAYTVDFSDPSYPRTLNKMGEALRDIVSASGVTEEVWNRYVLPEFPTDGTAASVGVTTREPQVGPLP